MSDVLSLFIGLDFMTTSNLCFCYCVESKV